MTPETLIEIGEALYGNQWQTDLARALSVEVRTVQRWAGGQRGIPAGLPGELRAVLVGRRDLIDGIIHRL